MMKRQPLQMAILIGVALVCAVVANGIASRQRKLVLPGYYPSALMVPERSAETPIPSRTEPAAVSAPVTQPATPAASAVPDTVAATEVKATAQPSVTKPPQNKGSVLGAAAPVPAGNLLVRFPPHPDKPYVEIGGDDVIRLHSAEALFLDARRTSIYEQGHIAGSRPFSVWESDVDDKVAALFEERGDPEAQLQPIVIYCSGGDCEDSHMLAQKLWGVQFNNVYVYKGGFPDWQRRGGAVRTGSSKP